MEIGKTYKVNHSRKGKFNIVLTNETDTWVTGTIIDGQAHAMLQENEKYEGESITVRKTLATFSLV